MLISLDSRPSGNPANWFVSPVYARYIFLRASVAQINRLRQFANNFARAKLLLENVLSLEETVSIKLVFLFFLYAHIVLRNELSIKKRESVDRKSDRFIIIVREKGEKEKAHQKLWK